MAETTPRDIKYLNKDFSSYRTNLINFAKTYFPNVYNDFNESDPGMLFIEMAAYVGDILTFQMDAQFKEHFIQYAEERKNILPLSYFLGYKPKNKIPASVEMDVYQLIPAIGSGNDNKPDWNYALKIQENMVISSDTYTDVEFRTENLIDFNFSSSYDPTSVTIYSSDGTGEPLYYLLNKKIKATSGKINSTTFDFVDPKPYDKIVLDNTNIISILDIYDSNGNKWYEVPYLAQTTIFESVPNLQINDPDTFQYYSETPYLLKTLKTSRKFITKYNKDNKLEIQFGSGISSEYDEEIIPNPNNIGNSLSVINSKIDYSIDPSNFLYTKTYGIAPSNTTLTIRYLTGNGISDNIPANTLNQVNTILFNDYNETLDTDTLNTVKDSVACINIASATGAKDTETIDEIRNNSIANFTSQNRTVTKDDYIIRCYSLPPQYGSISKAYIDKDYTIRNQTDIGDTFTLNLYVLGYDNNKKLVNLNIATKENLKTYLGEYRMLTDTVVIKNAYIINIGLDFEIITYRNYNANEVLLNCIKKLKDYFNIDKWQVNQPIIISNIYREINSVEGVQSVSNINFFNLYNKDDGYSGNIYDIGHATKDGVIYPAKDPSIFEVKYLNSDIRGKTNTF